MAAQQDHTVQWLVSGLVQGVGFRWYTWSMASRLGVRGWARNCPDGSVEVMGQGTLEDLALLEDALRRGPPASDVEHVEKQEITDEMHTFKTFEIK